MIIPIVRGLAGDLEAFCLFLLRELVPSSEGNDVHLEGSRYLGGRLANVSIAHHAESLPPDRPQLHDSQHFEWPGKGYSLCVFWQFKKRQQALCLVVCHACALLQGPKDGVTLADTPELLNVKGCPLLCFLLSSQAGKILGKPVACRQCILCQ